MNQIISREYRLEPPPREFTPGMLITSVLKKNGKLFSTSIHITKNPPAGLDPQEALSGTELVSRRRGQKPTLSAIESIINPKKGYLFNSKNLPDVYEERHQPTTEEDLTIMLKRMDPNSVVQIANVALSYPLQEEFKNLITRVFYRG